MIAYLGPTNRRSRGPVPRVPHPVAFALMILLGSLASPLLLSSASADVTKQVVSPASTASTTEAPGATANTQSTPVGTANAVGMSVTIYKWECVSGTLTGQPMSYYQGEDQCEGEKLDVVFDVTDDNGTQQTTSAKGGRQVDDLVGQVTVKEILPANYETPAIFCMPLNGQPGREITGSGNAVTLPADRDGAYQCSFYNIPSGVSATGTGDVLVYTYVCVSTPPPDSTYAWYHQNCTTRQNGATFVLNTPGADTELTAGDVLDGAVTMRGLEPGSYSLDETVMMPSHQIGAVFCAEIGKTEIPGPAQMMLQQLDGTTLSAPVTADMLFYCQWYHVPTGTSVTPVPPGYWGQFGVWPGEAGALVLAA